MNGEPTGYGSLHETPIQRGSSEPQPHDGAVGRTAVDVDGQSRDGTASATQPFRMSRIGKHSLIYGIGIIASKGVAFFMLPLYTRYLTPADYGILQLITMTNEAVSIFAGAKIAQGIFHFYHKADTNRTRREVMFTALSLLATTYVLTAGSMFALAPYIADVVFDARGVYVLYVRIAAASLAFQSLVLVPIAYLQLRDRSKLFVAVNLAKLVLQVTLNVILLIPFAMGVKGVLVSSLIAQMAMGCALAVYLVRDVGTRFSFPAARALVRFGLPLVVMQVASVVLTFGDRYFLKQAGDAAAVGIYGLAYQFGAILMTVGYLPFSRIWAPLRFEIGRRPDRNEIYSRVFIYVNILLVTIGLAIALFSRDFLRVIADRSFHAAAPLIPVIVLAYVFQAWKAFLNIGVFIKERTELFTLATYVAAFVALLGYIWLIPPLLVWGAALATLISFGVRLAVVYALSQKLWPIRYRWAPILRLLGIAGAVYLVAELFPVHGIGLSLAVRSGLFAAYLAGVWSLGVLSASERARLGQIMRQPRTAFARLMG